MEERMLCWVAVPWKEQPLRVVFFCLSLFAAEWTGEESPCQSTQLQEAQEAEKRILSWAAAEHSILSLPEWPLH